MTVKIPLTRGFHALVDQEDVDKVSRYKWQVCVTHRSTYAQTTIATENGRKCLFMHRLILLEGEETTTFVDHINGNGLDNRRSNLRECSRADNTRNKTAPICTNSSGCTGVRWRKDRQAWVAEIVVNSNRIYLGYFKEKDVAVKVRRNAEKKYYGDFAPASNTVQEVGPCK